MTPSPTMLTDAVILILGAGLILGAWDSVRQFIAARRFNQDVLDRVQKLETTSLAHEDRLDGLHSKLGAQQAATNNAARVRGLR